MRIVGFSWFDCRQSTTGRRGRRFVWLAGSGGVDIIAGPSVVFWGVSDCRQSMGALGGCRHAWLAGLGVSTPSRVQGVVFWTVDSQWQPLGLSGRVVGRFRGGRRHHRGPKECCFGEQPTVNCRLQPMKTAIRLVGRFRGGDTIASLGGGVLAIQHGGQRLPAVEGMFQQRSLTRAITSHRA